MELPNFENSYVCLSFEEANIFIENYRKQELPGMIYRLDNLLKHTVDSNLRKDLESLLRKLQNLTDEEYKLLVRDAEQGSIIFPPNYVLPYLA